MAKLLLEKDIDINAQDSIGRNSLMYCSMYGYLEIIKLLLNYERGCVVDPYIVDSGGNAASFFASFYGRKEIYKLLNLYIIYRKSIHIYAPSYNILIFILLKDMFTYTLPNEIILLIKNYGKEICGRELFR